ncbi:MAG: hypothetical protein KIS76_15180 [Pyrinomonadaceae bacterium]|nr:hypothetical protein [Pyrinomonadaceae bacterium]
MKRQKQIAIFLLFFALATAAVPTRAQRDKPESPNFRQYVEDAYRTNYKIKFSTVCPIDKNSAAMRVFEDYGAIFVSKANKAAIPTCIFENDQQVSIYQSLADPRTETIGGTQITLQRPAMEALLKARAEALKKGLDITPRGGSISASRSFEDTYKLWNSRFFPALDHWVMRGKITKKDADEAKTLEISKQVARVLDWEDEGFYFSTAFNKSILFSVAAPGASQHIFMLALDVKQFGDKKVRAILAQHGWFQTVKSDLPHFTYLGTDEKDLPKLGLRSITVDGHEFWIPNM